MPIRFSCEQCGQKLTARSRQIGHEAKCPKCKHEVTVPAASTRQSGRRPPPEDDAAPGDGAADDDVYSQFVVYDDDAEWVYEDETDPIDQHPAAVSVDRVSIPRVILYTQGILLAVVAIVAFAFGILVGGGRAEPEPAEVVARPCTIKGQVRYMTPGGAEIPDEGSVVIMIPQDERPSPDQRSSVEGLRPTDPLPQEDHPALRAIRMLGGAYTRADADGTYEFRLPEPGQYYLLVLSGNRRQDASEAPVRADLAEMGSYFLPATELLADHRYAWKSITVRSDQTLADVVF